MRWIAKPTAQELVHDLASTLALDHRFRGDAEILANLGTKLKITFDALSWHMAERIQQTPLLAGDTIDIAFTVGHTGHPEYGGLELSLRDFQVGRNES
jgi:hypothetical protein